MEWWATSLTEEKSYTKLWTDEEELHDEAQSCIPQDKHVSYDILLPPNADHPDS